LVNVKGGCYVSIFFKFLLEQKVMTVIVILGMICVVIAIVKEVRRFFRLENYQRILLATMGILLILISVVTSIIFTFRSNEKQQINFTEVQSLGDCISIKCNIVSHMDNDKVYRYFNKSDDKYFFCGENLRFYLPYDSQNTICIYEISESLDRQIQKLVNNENNNDDYLEYSDFETDKAKLISSKELKILKEDLSKIIFSQ